MTTADNAKKPDWSLIEAEYRAGIKSLRQIAEDQGVSHVYISKRAKKEGWTKDLSAKIKAKADELVNNAAVNTTVNAAKRVTENAVIAANATAVYQVRIEHRTDIRRSRALFQNLLGELEVVSTPEGQSLLDELVDAMNDPADGGEPSDQAAKRAARMREVIQKALSVPGRIAAGKQVVEMLEKCIRLEREAFGMTIEDGKPAPVQQVIVIPPKDAE
jgi:hypothetical protein